MTTARPPQLTPQQKAAQTLRIAAALEARPANLKRAAVIARCLTTIKRKPFR